MSEIKIEVKELNTELTKLELSIEEFKPYNKKFINETADKLDEANSDFVEMIQKTLKNMKDTNAPKLLEKIQTMYDKTKAVVDTFAEVDTGISDTIEGGGNDGT